MSAIEYYCGGSSKVDRTSNINISKLLLSLINPWASFTPFDTGTSIVALRFRLNQPLRSQQVLDRGGISPCWLHFSCIWRSCSLLKDKQSMVSEYCLRVKAVKTQDCTSMRKFLPTPGNLCKTDNTLQFRTQMKKIHWGWCLFLTEKLKRFSLFFLEWWRAQSHPNSWEVFVIT